MSRIGNAPVAVPSGVDITVAGQTVTVKGPKGELSQVVPELITVRQEGDEVLVERSSDDRESRSLHGLMRSLVANMVTGVTDGYVKNLEIQGVGYRATAKGDRTLELALGFSHPVTVEAPEGVTFNVPQPTQIEVHGIDKQLVGQVAANIRRWREPEPYKGKGVRYAGEHVRRKAGKAGK
ncbi:MAG: 50S ribosomal protein L6 [Microthrixaceae bacterium]|nr:50S ribosomal protein L6 [Microthrixaceae bacterium]MCO5319171.1 50S ribosomal protein L6 [Microthrixaceae bacterium]